MSLNSFPFRIVSGFRPLRGLHIGHYGAVLRDLIRLQYAQPQTAFVFVADHHARSKWDDKADFVNLAKNARHTARQLIALGIDPDYTVLYRQSDIPEIFEIMWFFAGVVSDGVLRRGHAMGADSSPTAGTYLYPLLMVSDILSLRATHVAIGSDQKQHLEVARDVARKLRRRFAEGLLPVPEPLADEPQLIAGIDSPPDKPKKMASESNNEVPLFADEDTVRGRIDRIVTKPIKWGEQLPVQDCSILRYARCIGGAQTEAEFAQKYAGGGYGYSDAKNDLAGLFFDTFSTVRKKYHQIDDADVERILHAGAVRAREQIAGLLFRLRNEVRGDLATT